MQISSLGEFGLINKIASDLVFCNEGLIKGIGDDTAVLKFPDDKHVLMTTDMFVEGVHFRKDYGTFEQVGWRIITANVSDIAAMGGRPAHATVSLGIPAGMELEAGRLLSRSGMVTSMNDISDGLASELHEICTASGTGFVIVYKEIPVAASTMEVAVCCGQDAVEWALFGGEDFELVFTVKPAFQTEVEALFRKEGLDLFYIGYVTPKEEGFHLKGTPQGHDKPILPKGYNHFTD